MTLDAIRFPAIAFSPGDSFLVVHELPSIGTPLSFKRGYFSALQLYDSAGALWRVIRAEPEIPLSSLDRLLNRRISIRLQLGPPERPDVRTVANQLCALVDADPDDLYPPGIKARLLSAPSPADLIRAITDAG
jgi:hypothetical protein